MTGRLLECFLSRGGGWCEAIHPYPGDRSASDQPGFEQRVKHVANTKPCLAENGFNLSGAHGAKTCEEFA